MTISVSKNMLLAKLQQLSRIIPSKSTTPIVCNYLFEIKDGRLFITTANDEGRITASLECMAEEDLSICVPASILDGLKTLPEQPLDIYINPDNKSILIKYYGGKFEVVGYDSKPFPQKKKTEILDEIRTTAEEFNNGISKVINFAAADELRPIMNSVSIETAPGEIIFVSSNGHGLGLFKRKKQCCTETCSVIISRQIASVLKGLIPLSEEELTIKVGSDWSEISFEDYEISFRNVEGRYPNWRAVVPKSNNLELKTDTKLLLGAIKRTSVFSSKVSCLIKLSARYDKLVVSAQDLDYSTSAEETIPVEFGEREFIIGVKATLIQDMISCIDGDRSKVWASKGDEFAGLAELNAGKIRSISSTQILLLSKYKEDFKAHAGISFKNENGDIYVNIKKGTPSPAWLIPLQQRLCLISKVEKIDLKK